MEGGKTTELSDSHFHRKMRIKGPIPAPLTLPPQPTLSSQKREDMSVPKEQNEQMMPLWAHLMPGNHGPSPLVPAILCGGLTCFLGTLCWAFQRSPEV